MCTLLDMRFKFIRLWLNHIFSLKVGVLFHGQLNRIYLVYKGLIIPNLPLFNKINWISMKQVFSENMLSDFSDYLHEMKKCNFWDRPNWKKKKNPFTKCSIRACESLIFQRTLHKEPFKTFVWKTMKMRNRNWKLSLRSQNNDIRFIGMCTFQLTVTVSASSSDPPYSKAWLTGTI